MSCKSKKFVVTSLTKKGNFKGGCLKCGQTGSGFLNKVISNLPFEMHLPGHNFTGPGTQLLWGKTRLNPDLTYKNSSKPVNRVDEIAYKHDKCYLENKDTKSRNEVCDKNMIDQLDNIENPTMRERFERGIVKPIIQAKKSFGMGSISTKIYCLKCKNHTETKDIKNAMSKNNRPMMKGICLNCGSKKSVFLGKP